LLVIGINTAFLYVIHDFLMTLFMAAILSGLAHPAHRRVTAALGGRSAAAAVVTLVPIVLLIGAPLVAVVSMITGEAMRISNDVTPWLNSVVSEPTLLNTYLDGIPGIQRLAPYREQILLKAGDAVGGLGSAVVASVSGMTRNTLASIVSFS
jgi:predicted PurR-regulated permease PerM